jgi:hypothetical protein
MFCDQCGGQLQAGQQTCARCGKPVIGLVYRRNRVQEHVRLVGILWLAYSAFTLLGGVAVEIIAHTIFGSTFPMQSGPPPEIRAWLGPFLTFIGGLILVKAAVGFIAGWGLLQREEWGRVVALVVGFVSLFNVPIGTALGIYTLWVLLPTQSDDEYRQMVKVA